VVVRLLHDEHARAALLRGDPGGERLRRRLGAQVGRRACFGASVGAAVVGERVVLREDAEGNDREGGARNAHAMGHGLHCFGPFAMAAIDLAMSGPASKIVSRSLPTRTTTRLFDGTMLMT